MTDKQRITKAEQIVKETPQFFYWICQMAEEADSEEAKEHLDRLSSRAYHLQEGGDI